MNEPGSYYDWELQFRLFNLS
ncbi:hypothetical protein LCGC14_2925950, partial [marine sediment metagenome]